MWKQYFKNDDVEVERLRYEKFDFKVYESTSGRNRAMVNIEEKTSIRYKMLLYFQIFATAWRYLCGYIRKLNDRISHLSSTSNRVQSKAYKLWKHVGCVSIVGIFGTDRKSGFDNGEVCKFEAAVGTMREEMRKNKTMEKTTNTENNTWTLGDKIYSRMQSTRRIVNTFQ